MSSSRARMRFVAVTASIPLLVGAGPLVTPAVAAEPYAVTNLLAAGQAIGPNTGYLGLGVGQGGSTALFKVTAPSSTTTISAVTLTLTQLDNPQTFVYQNELDATDGLALYADVNGNGEFDAGDKTDGLRSNGFRSGRVQPNGDIPFLVSLAAPTSGAEAYFLAIHPSSTAVSGRRMAFRVDTGNIVGSGGNGPTAPEATPLKTDNADPRLVIDSAGPVAPDRSAFTAASNAPGEEDSYTLATGTVTETSAKLAFYNAENSLAPTALLTRPGFNPALPVTSQLGKVAFQNAVNPASPASPTVALIGDGSGIVSGVTAVAKNNQVSNAVFARLIDSVGNASSPVILSDCFVAPNTTACETARGNPVIGPEKPATAVLPSGAINLTNEAAVPLDVTTSSTSVAARTNRATAGSTNADTSSQAVKVDARIVQVTPTGAIEDGYGTVTKQKAYASGATTLSWTAADGFDTTLKPEAPKGIKEGSALAVAVAINVDRAGNPSALTQSTTKYTKDVTAPTLTISSSTSPLVKGNTVQLQFSEAMTKSSINDSAAPSPATGLCTDDVGARSAEKVLDVVDDQPGNTDRTWGLGYCFAWNSQGTGATITIGDERPQGCSVTPGDDCVLRPSVGDLVRFAGAGGSSLTDAAGNLVVGLGSAPFHTVLVTPPPVPSSARTVDANVDGILDAVDVTFSSEQNLSSMQSSLAQFSAVGSNTVPITGVSFPTAGNDKIVRFAFVSQFGTGDVPQIRLTAPTGSALTGVVDKGNQPMPAFSITPTDLAIPQPRRAVTVDSNRDGMVDQISLQYSEVINHARDNNPAARNVAGAAYNVPGYAPAPPTGGNEGRNTVNPSTGTGSTKLVTLTRPSSAGLDTGSTAFSVKFTRFTDPVDGVIYGPTDPNGNSWTDGDNVFLVAAADGAAPFYASRHTRDLDADGRVDAIDVKFTENIPTASTGASFTVTGHQILDQFALGTDGIRIVIDETAPATGDTAASMTPTLQYHGGVSDTAGNLMTADQAPVTTSDGAGPAIMAACPSSPKGANGTCPEDDPAVATDDGTRMNVFFSEALIASTVVAGDFVVEQPAGATPAKTVSGASVANAADNKSSVVTLTFAQGTLASATDSVVRLAGNGVVSDTSSVVSTQTSNVVAPAPPTVSLAISCPTQTANPQYCSSTTVNTGAAGSTAVTKWRLKETARGTVIDPNDYKTTRPDTITLVEGSYTLYLSGLDSFGRLSPEVSAPISILTPPRIENVQFVNATTRGSSTFSKNDTLMDGDSLNIGARAYGSDAAEWAEGGAPVGGGCLAQNMAIDLRAITGNTADGNRAPTSCNLSPATAEQKYRDMVFPVTKATRTTRYPVGTVLKVTDSDPGSIVVDGANGTLARRQFISVGARRSWMISDASVIKVPSHLYSSIPRNSKNVGYRDGALLRSSTGYYYVENGVKRPVSSYRLSVWRISTSTAYRPTTTELRAMPTGKTIGGTSHQAGTWIKYSNGKIYQVARNAQGRLVRRPLAHSAALRTLVPTSQIYRAVSADSNLPVDTWLRGYRDGTILVWKNSAGQITKTGVIARGSLRMFANPQTFNTLGFNASNGLSANGLAMPRVSGQAYRIGEVIDRYALGEVVIKVTNKAGATATAEVPNAAGLYGVGTLDPAPAGWDFTR